MTESTRLSKLWSYIAKSCKDRAISFTVSTDRAVRSDGGIITSRASFELGKTGSAGITFDLMNPGAIETEYRRFDVVLEKVK